MPAPVLPLMEAAEHWPPRGTLIGLDLGTKTIGVAASDPDRRLASLPPMPDACWRSRKSGAPSGSCLACR
jgi:hypothetical protein